MSGGSPRRYPPELRERPVRMVAEISDQHEWEWAAISEVARLLGVGTPETVRQVAPPSRTAESTELRRVNAISKTASAFFAAELDRPAH